MTRKLYEIAFEIGGKLQSSLRTSVMTAAGQLETLDRRLKELDARKMHGPGFDAYNAKIDSTVQKLNGLKTKLREVQGAIAANEQRRSNLRGQIVDTAALGLAVAVPVRLAMDREYALAQIGTLTGQTNAELAALQKEIEKTANLTYNKYGDMLTSLNILIAEGMDIKPAVKLQQVIGQTATAASADITDIAKTANSLFGSMKVPVDEVSVAFDKLVAAGKAGSFELKDMSQYFPMLTAQASSLGLTGVNGVVTLAASLQMARRGASDAATAANNFNNFLSKLTAPETKKRFSEMGVDIEKAFKDSISAGKDPVIEMIKLTKELTGGDKFRIGELFGDMQVIGFLNPIMQDMKSYEKLLGEIGSANGQLQKDFDRMASTSTRQSILLTNTLTNLSGALGAILLPAVNAVASKMAAMAAKLAALSEKYPELTKAIVIGAAGLIAFKVAALAVGYASTFVIGGFLQLWKTITMLRTAWLLYTGAMVVSSNTSKIAIVISKALTAAQWLFNAALSASPIGMAIRLVAGLVAVGTLLYTNWDTIAAVATRVWTGVTDGVRNTIGAVKSFLSSIDLSAIGAAIMDTLISGIRAKAQAVVDSVKDTFSKVREYMPFSDAKRGPLSQLTASGKAIVSTLAAGVSSAPSDAIAKQLQGKLSVQTSGGTMGAGLAGGGMGQQSKALTQGGSNNMSVTFAPQITLPAGSPEQTRQAADQSLAVSMREFERKMREMISQQGRTSYA